MDVAGNVQLSYDNTAFSQYVVVTGNASVLTLNDTYKNLPTTTTTAISTASNNCFKNSSNYTFSTTDAINTNLNNNYFNNGQLSNIFITSNVLSNTSNTIHNRPDIFTKLETSNIFTTSNHINTNFYSKSQIDTEIKTNSILIKKSITFIYRWYIWS